MRQIVAFALAVNCLVGANVAVFGDAKTSQPVNKEWLQLATLGYYGEADAEKAWKLNGECAGAPDGSELIGNELKEWSLTDWRNSASLSMHALRGRVVVVRFWTADCAACEKTLPALQQLATEFRGQPVTFMGAFTAKPADSVKTMDGPSALAKKMGVTFALALDPEWRTLKSWYLDGHHRHASSATFVVGKDGRVAYVHPGPIFYPTNVPADAKANQDFLAVRQAITNALAGGSKHAVAGPHTGQGSSCDRGDK